MSHDSRDAATPTSDASDPALRRAMLDSLDRLLEALLLDPIGEDRFRALSEPGRFADRIYGGQLVAQALLAASRTVDGKDPLSLHACFVESGSAGQPVEIAVERVRDGSSISTRRVSVLQDDRTLLTALASFHRGPAEPERALPPPDVASPDTLPLIQEWVNTMSGDARTAMQSWVAQPPPIEMRIGEAPNFLGGACAEGPRSHWLRLPRDVGDDPLVHQVLLAYASDYLLLDMACRAQPDRREEHQKEPPADAPFAITSLDHCLWFHRPTRFDRWHLYTQECQSLSGHRGLVRGTIHDADGHLVASAMQAVIVRPARGAPASSTA